MIKAGSLTYTVFVSVITAVLCTLMISLAYMNRSFFIQTDWNEKVRDNAGSGIALGMTLEAKEDHEAWHDLYGENSDSVKIKRRKWGLYDVISSHAVKKGRSHDKTTIIGYNSPELKRTALWLADRNRPLQLAGSALLRGECQLPVKGVDRAYIEGTNYTREKLVYGKVNKSAGKIPEPETDHIEYWQSYFDGKFNSQDSLYDLNKAPHYQKHSFQKKTLTYHTRKPLETGNMKMEGNIILSSSSQIRVSASSNLEQVVLLAPRILIESGFKGSLHAIATDTIWIAEDVSLHYPSSLLMMNKSIDKPPFLKIEAGCDIRASVVNQSPNVRRSNKRNIELDKEAKLHGLLYTDGNLQLNGKVDGTVICNNFLLATTSGIYENHLLNGEIDRSKLGEEFAAFPLKEWKNKAKTLLWLYY